LACTGSNALAHNNLGSILTGLGLTDEAIVHYRAALAINPNYLYVRNNLGSALAKQGHTEEAIAQYRKAIAIGPNHANAHHNLGNALAELGRLDEAVSEYRKALRIDPDLAKAHYQLGTTLIDMGKPDDAITEFRRTLEIEPDDVDARYNLGVLLNRQGKTAEAVVQWREALRLRPDDTGILDELAWTLATCPEARVRNGPEAVDLARRAIKLSDGQSAEMLGTLAAAYAETGRFTEAVQTADRALTLALAHGETKLADACRAQIKLYQSRQPYRESPQSKGDTGSANIPAGKRD
jgi:tetratricopeptide (TPR) repeat protein